MELGGGSRRARALAGLTAAFDHYLAVLADGSLEGQDHDSFVQGLQGFEEFRNRLPLADHLLVKAAVERDLAGELGQSKLAPALAQTLRISSAEAGRRVRAAEQLGGRVSILGEVLPAQRPVLAAAQAAGAVSPEQVNIILKGLAQVDRAGYDPADIARGEATLTGYAATFGPKDLHVCVERFVAHLDPDGSRPRDDLNFDRRFVELRPCEDGSWVGKFRLTGPVGAKLHALLSPLAKPRVNTVTTETGAQIRPWIPGRMGSGCTTPWRTCPTAC